MAKLAKIEIIDLPKVCVVGKLLKVSDEACMSGDNPMPAFWGQCFEENLFGILEQQPDFIYDDAYVGWMSDWGTGDGQFSYIVGMLMNEGVTVPDGCVIREIPATKAAVGWIQGKDDQSLYSSEHELTDAALKQAGHSGDGAKWCMELYNCPRFTTPDENGEVILDYYIPLD